MEGSCSGDKKVNATPSMVSVCTNVTDTVLFCQIITQSNFKEQKLCKYVAVNHSQIVHRLTSDQPAPEDKAHNSCATGIFVSNHHPRPSYLMDLICSGFEGKLRYVLFGVIQNSS